MGMFDYFYIEEGVELPDGWVNPRAEFQTKSLYSFMEKYRLTKNGRLQKWINDGWEGTGEFTERVLFGRTEKQREINGRWSDNNYHGDVYFYAAEKPNYEWHEYRARFTEGVLHGPLLTKDTIEDVRDWHGG